MPDNKFKPCIIIPCYRHVEKLLTNMPYIMSLGFDVIVVDDGNSCDDKNKLSEGLAHYPNVSLISIEVNSGKGAAMVMGFRFAHNASYTHALQIDADGQQNLQSITNFIERAKNNPKLLILGVPKYSNVPFGRLISRYITHFWVAIEMGLFRVIDSMCGMRVYPLDNVNSLLNARSIGKRMDFDTEILVRLYWMGTDFIEQDVEVTYPTDGISNFAMFSDNFRISWMHTKLCSEKIFHYWSIHQRKYL